MKTFPLYTLSVEVNPDQKTGQARDNLKIELPFRVDFEIERNSLATSQTARFVIHGLGEKTRNLIYRDLYAFNDYRAVQFFAGYDDIGKALVFNGTVREAYSQKTPTGVITIIEAYDGGYAMANANSLITIGAGIKFSDILNKLNGDLPFVAGNPIIGDFSNRTLRGSTYVGSTWTYIYQISNGLATIDNGQLKALQPNEAFDAPVNVITSDSGLLNAPQRAKTVLSFPMIFEPRITVGQIVYLKSTVNALFNGAYKVTGFSHKGTISTASAGEPRVTVVNLWKGEQAFRIVAARPVQ